jgi:hypothetical protein
MTVEMKELGFLAMGFNEGQWDTAPLGPIKKFGTDPNTLTNINGIIPEVIICVEGYFQNPYGENSWMCCPEIPQGWKVVRASFAVNHMGMRISTCSPVKNGKEFVVMQLKLHFDSND